MVGAMSLFGKVDCCPDSMVHCPGMVVVHLGIVAVVGRVAGKVGTVVVVVVDSLAVAVVVDNLDSLAVVVVVDKVLVVQLPVDFQQCRHSMEQVLECSLPVVEPSNQYLVAA